jgi:signal peptidase I
VLAGTAIVTLAARPVRRVAVVGGSMAPALEPGDRLVVLRLPARWPLRAGDVVAFPDPRSGPDRQNGRDGLTLVKRVRSVGPAGVEVRGDDPDHSTDSRSFGSVPRRSVLGVAIYRYAPPGRTRVIRRGNGSGDHRGLRSGGGRGSG